MKKQVKENKNATGTTKKVGRSIREVIPTVYKYPRESTPVNLPDKFTKSFEYLYEPCGLFPEWNETDARNLQSEELIMPGQGQSSKGLLFTDPEGDKILLPMSLLNDSYNEVKWLRPNEYIREVLLDREISLKHPNKNCIKLRKQIKEMYREYNLKNKSADKNENVELNKRLSAQIKEQSEKSETDIDNWLHKDLFNILERKLDLKVVETSEREETEEEFKLRRKNEEELQIQLQMQQLVPDKNADKKKTNTNSLPIKKKLSNVSYNTAPFNESKLQVNECNAGNINMKEKYTSYCKWIASIFQLIKDLNLTDVNTSEKIYQKIYPQENNVPVYNPSGRYWVKLYHMGKLRKLEIDDLMPCSKYDDFLLPKCDNLEELWPALLTKAIFKLYSYKLHTQSFFQEEVGDCSVIFALTGYIGEQLSFTKSGSKQDLMVNLFKNLLRDECFINKQKVLLCYHRKETPIVSCKDIETLKDTSSVNKVMIGSIDKLKQLNFKQAKVKEDFENNNNINHLNVNCTNTKIAKERTNQTVKTMIVRRNKRDLSVKEKMNSNDNRGQGLKRNNSSDFKNRSGSKFKTTVNRRNSTSIRNMREDLTKQDISKTLGAINNEILMSSKNIIPKKSLLGNPQTLQNIRESKLFNTIKLASSKLLSFIFTNKQQLENEKKDNVYTNCLYSVLEIFDTENFNMKRLKPIDFSYLKLNLKNAKVSYKTLPLIEKKKYVQSLLELKNQQKEEKLARIEELKLPGKQFLSLKIKNNAIGANKEFAFPYTEEEIEMAKKCLLNNWDFPPAVFLDKIYYDREKFKEMITDKIAALNKDVSSIGDQSEDSLAGPSHTWNKQVYMQLINNNAEKYKHGSEPFGRDKGSWVCFEDFAKIFNQFIILHNPKFYKNVLMADCNFYNHEFDIYELNPDFAVLSLKGTNPDKLPFNSKYDINFSSLLLKFTPNNEMTNALRDNQFYIIFDLLDQDHSLVLENIKLYGFSFSFQYDFLDFSKNYFLILKGGLFPLGFHLTIYSDHSIENMSYFTYLKNYMNYFSLTYKIERPAIEMKKLFLMQRLIINNNNVNTHLRFSIKSNSSIDHENYLRQFFDLYLLNQSGETKKIYFSDVCRIESSEEDYYLILTFTPPNNLPENSYTLELLSDNHQLKVDAVEHLDPYEVSDYYVPNKHGIVFKEIVFVAEKVFVTLSVSLRRVMRTCKQNEANSNMLLKKKVNIVMSNSFKQIQQVQQDSEIEETVDMDDRIRMHIEIYNTKDHTELIFKSEFFTSTNLLNLILEGIPVVPPVEPKKGVNPKDKDLIPVALPPQNSPYLILCYLDMSEIPEYLKTIDPEKEITWNIRVLSSDTLGFVKDTSKEESESNLKDSWDVIEPGRSEKAKKSRVRFLVQQKKNNGEKLTPEEELLLMEERERKIFTPKIDLGNNVMPKEDKKNVKNLNKKVKEEPPKEVIIETPSVNFNKTLPKPEEHSSMYIKNFIGYAYQNNRTVIADSKLKQEEKIVINEVTKESKKSEIIEFCEQFEHSHMKDLDELNNRKTRMNESLKSFYQISTKSRYEEKEKNSFLNREREELSNQISTKKDADKKLIDIITTSENTNPKDTFDMNACVMSYNQIKSSGYNSDLLERVHSLISKKKEEMIKAEFKKIGTNLKELKSFSVKILDDIKDNKWRISEEVLKSLINS